MAARKRPETKLDALREAGTVNPRPELVRDEPFLQIEFFDVMDLLQVKYEMLRRVRVDGASVTEAADTFGLSRPSFYTAQAAFTRGGLAALLPRKRGPRGGHKLIPEIVLFLDELRTSDTSLAASRLVPMVRNRFGVKVHPRSIERALKRLEKKRR